MEALAHNYVFPNDLHAHWTLMIVIYPYITGIVAGAFIVSALSHIFKLKSLAPVTRFALIFSFCWLVFVSVPLLNHLGRPERALNIMLTPNFQGPSMMAAFGYVYALYMLLVVVEIFFEYRADFLALAKSGSKFAPFYKVAAFIDDDESEAALERDRKMVVLLSAIGIPLACALHGYVGFIFGAVKTVEWWFTPLMPIIFLLSASVSGIAGVILFYLIVKKLANAIEQVQTDTIKTLVQLLWVFFIFDFLFEMLEIATAAYGGAAGWGHIRDLLSGPLYNSFWIWQVSILSVIPFLALGWLSIARVQRSTLLIGSAILSTALMAQVFFMRWNVVIGGQLIGKSERGFASYHPLFFEKEGILATIIILAGPVVLFWILRQIFPLWDEKHSLPARERALPE